MNTEPALLQQYNACTDLSVSSHHEKCTIHYGCDRTSTIEGCSCCERWNRNFLRLLVQQGHCNVASRYRWSTNDDHRTLLSVRWVSHRGRWITYLEGENWRVCLVRILYLELEANTTSIWVHKTVLVVFRFLHLGCGRTTPRWYVRHVAKP